jgi:hypothetical protein
MKCQIIGQCGLDWALAGMALNKQKNPADMYPVLMRLAGKGHGHDKGLRFMPVCLRISASRKFWQEFATYRIGTQSFDGDEIYDDFEDQIVSNSASTMNNIADRYLTADDFESQLPPGMLEIVNGQIDEYRAGRVSLAEMKDAIPEGLLQERVILMNMAVVENICAGRLRHRLYEWQILIQCFIEQLEYPELIPSLRGLL